MTVRLRLLRANANITTSLHWLFVVLQLLPAGARSSASKSTLLAA